MEENVFETWAGNIKGMLDTQEDLKKKNLELETKLSTLELSNLQNKTNPAVNVNTPIGMEADFANALRSPETVEGIAKLARKEVRSFGFELTTKAVQDMTFANVFSTAGAAVSLIRPGIVGPAPRKYQMRDVLPLTESYTRDFVYVKETATVDGGPRFTPSGSIKPVMSLNFQQVTAQTQFLAATCTIDNSLLLDVNGMIPYLQNRLVQELLNTESLYIITGSGVSPYIGGLHLSGNYTSPTGSATIDIEQLYQAIWQLKSANRNPTAVILNPVDAGALQINKASTAGLYSLPASVSVAADGTMRIAGVLVVENLAQVSGSFDVIDSSGMTLVQRTAPVVEFFVDSVLASKNQTMVRVEERIAFAVFASTYDVYGTF